MLDTETVNDMKPLFTKGIELHNKILNHITTLVNNIVGLEGMPRDTIKQHVDNHLENFDDLGYAKMMGGTEEYLNERKVLIEEYEEILAPFIQNTEAIICGCLSANSTKLSKAHSLFGEMRNTSSPYYHQLTKHVNLIYSIFTK